MESNDKKFVNGLFIEKPKDGTPDFVKARISINATNFIEYLKQNANGKGYVNIDLLESKEGKLYAKLNDFKPKTETKPNDEPISVENCPF